MVCSHEQQNVQTLRCDAHTIVDKNFSVISLDASRDALVFRFLFLRFSFSEIKSSACVDFSYSTSLSVHVS